MPSLLSLIVGRALLFKLANEYDLPAMRKIKVEPKQVLALAATFYRVRMSLFRLPGDFSEEFIDYFREKEHELECLHSFIELCEKENVPILFEKYPPLWWEQKLQYRLFQKRAFTERELGTIAFFCREILQIIANPSREAIRKSKFWYNCDPFRRCVLYPHLTLRQIRNTYRLDFFYHPLFLTSFSLKEILAAKRTLKSTQISNPEIPYPVNN